MNPLLGTSENDNQKTVFSAIRTILSFFGYTNLGTHSSNYEFPKP